MSDVGDPQDPIFDEYSGISGMQGLLVSSEIADGVVYLYIRAINPLNDRGQIWACRFEGFGDADQGQDDAGYYVRMPIAPKNLEPGQVLIVGVS